MSSLELQTSGLRGGNRYRIRNVGEVVVRVDYKGIREDFSIYFDAFTGQGPNFKQRENTLINIFGVGGMCVFSGTTEQLCDILLKEKSLQLIKHYPDEDGTERTDQSMHTFEPEAEYFKATGVYCISNCGGFEVEISSCGDMARMKDAFGSDNPQISDWKTIEHVPDPEDPEELIAMIDPEGFNIPLNLVMRS